MAYFYVDDEEVWKCTKHPSKRRKTGICATCLRESLATLCPECANVRPCECGAAATSSSSSSSSSSSFSFFSSRGTGVGEVDRVSNLIDGEPSFRRSRSVAFPFLRSRFGSVREFGSGGKPPLPENKTKSSFWSAFRTSKSKSNRGGEEREDGESKKSDAAVDYDFGKIMMMRSRSVSVQAASNFITGDFRSSASPAAKGRRWHFPSPIKAFRHSKTSKVDQESSPMYRG